MPFLLDFHIHSHFSIATSKECDPEHLFLWACLKGLTVIGTGDFTHPGWLEELNQKLIPAEEGLYRLKPDLENAVLAEIPKTCHRDVRFILSSEISSIYKKAGRVRKIHNCLMVPSLDDAKAISERLERIGNIRADGRPILGLDSHDLLEIMLEASPQGIFIPAHVWTPHFSLFGAYSGFDALEECFEDLSSYIWALETGLSSDPPMNWRVSQLDRYTLVSNSDAHSPKNLARESNILDCEISFPAIRSAIKGKGTGQFLGTVEFFPQEGKYHFDGHRNCGIRLHPEDTIKAGGICPKCGKKLTLGVMHRVVDLADRPTGFIPEKALPFHSLIPLREILSDYFGCGANAKRVSQAYFNLIQKLGTEWDILTSIPSEELKVYAGPSLAEGIERIRTGKVTIKPGFDGEYGTISIFSPEDRIGKMTQKALFARHDETPCILSKPPPSDSRKKKGNKNKKSSSSQELCKNKESIFTAIEGSSGMDHLNLSQLQSVQASSGPVLVIAGPGTGKTRTLAFRILHLIKERGIRPEEILAITFTNKAAKEMSQRLDSILPNPAALPSRPFIGTFHHFCLGILKKHGNPPDFRLFHTYDSLAMIDLILKNIKQAKSLRPRDCLQKISLIKSIYNDDHPEEDLNPFLFEIYEQYQQGLEKYRAFDYDDLLIKTAELLEQDEKVAQGIRNGFKSILVDEFQDVNPVQYRLLLLLADKKGTNLFLIGDPNQAIYGFRGSDNTLFFRIEKEFHGCQIFSLEKNYRSTSPIVDSACELISFNPQQTPLNLESVRGDGPPIKILTLPSEKSEGIAIVREISTLMGGIDMLQAHGESGIFRKPDHSDYSFSDFAVLFRTGNQADILEECLLKEGIPYRLGGYQGIMDNPLIRQILAFLRWCYHPTDEHSFLQALDLPIFSMEKDEKSRIFKSLSDDSHRIGLDDGDKAQSLLSRFSSGLMTDPKMAAITKAMTHFQNIVNEGPPSKFIDKVISVFEEQGLQKTHQKDLNRLSLLAEEFSDISSFLDRVTLYRDGDISWKGKKGEIGMEMVSLMTLHAAKGLEFPVVFVCGCEDGILPHKHREGNPGIDEERRLFYVGMTRAKDRLYLSWCRNRYWNGKRQATQVSSFLEEIPETFSERISLDIPKPLKPDNKQLSLW